MSAEAFVIAALVEDGSPKKAFQAGVVPRDFIMYEDEYAWIVDRASRQRSINRRVFQQAFPDFEWVKPNERLQDLLQELKDESGYSQLRAALEQCGEELTPDNFTDKADFMREVIADVLRVHSPASDIILSSDVKPYLQRMKNLQITRAAGETPGIPTGIKTLDGHWGGLVNGRTYLVLGRPGDAKSFTQAKWFVSGFLDGRIMAMFSPEMNEDEHRARVATLISADPRVQEELGLKKAFRNRALLDGTGYNYKTLKRLWEWIEEQPGSMVLFTRKHRMGKMTPSFIESKISDIGIEAVFVDPIYKLRPSERMQRMSGPEKISQITDELCDISESHDIPLIMSNQAHRQMGNRGDAPTKDNSFNSDAPVQEADCVLGVKHITDERKLILRCTKNRWGEEFRVDIKFVPNIGMMTDVSKRNPNYYNGNQDGSDERVKEAVEEIEKEMGYSKV